MIVGSGVTLFSIHVFIPEISSKFSSRGVLLAYDELRESSSPLLAYNTPIKTMELTGSPDIEEKGDSEELVKRLVSEDRVFALIQNDDLARVDTRYRVLTGKHLPVLFDSNASTLLVSNRLSGQRENLNILEKIVPLISPRPSRPIRANFDDKIELLGLDIVTSDREEDVCPMGRVTLRFYWKCLKTISGNQEIFVHVDGFGQRVNGDHYPANGKYLVRYWNPGDNIVDEVPLEIPAHFPAGDYNIYVGFFQGSQRLPIKEGSATSENRLKAGILRVR